MENTTDLILSTILVEVLEVKKLGNLLNEMFKKNAMLHEELERAHNKINLLEKSR